MTISNQYLLIALIVFMTISAALFVLRFRVEWKRLQIIEPQNAVRKQSAEASDKRLEQHQADMTATKAQTEVFAARAEQLQLRYIELAQRNRRSLHAERRHNRANGSIVGQDRKVKRPLIHAQ